jgi:hypothetical protein
MRWLYEGNEQLAGLQQWPHLWREPIPLNRMVHYRLRSPLDSPEGRSLLRPAWLPFYYATGLQEIEAIGEERMNGIPVITPPMGADTDPASDDMVQANLIARNYRVDEQAGIILPPPSGEGEHMRWNIRFETGAANARQIGDIISRHEKRMLMSFLAQFLMLGMDNVGALSTFEGSNDFFTSAINAVADTIADQFTRQPLRRLMVLNGQDPTGIYLIHTPAGNTKLDAIGNFLQVIGGFITFTAEDEQTLRTMARLPERSIEEIEASRDEERERKREAAAMFRPQSQPLPNQPQQPLAERDDNRAAWYAVGSDDVATNSPDDKDRLGMERTWYDKAVGFFTGQQKRIVKGVKEL